MAISSSHKFLIPFSFLFFLSLVFPAASSSALDSKLSTSVLAEEGDDVHEILPKFNLPNGLFPDTPNTYSLAADGSITVRLGRSCYVHIDDQVVYYHKLITAKIGSGAVSDVSGIQAKKFFLWIPVTGMSIDLDSRSIEFHVGALSQSLPADRFEAVPRCMSSLARSSILLSSS